MTEEELAEIFSYDSEEQGRSAALKRYMAAVSPMLPELLRDSAFRDRFILAGMFQTYREWSRTNHSMRAQDLDADDDSRHARRLRAYEQIFGESLDANHDYLKKIGYSVWTALIRSPGKHLARFVLGS